jgi:hypothetical protein
LEEYNLKQKRETWIEIIDLPTTAVVLDVVLEGSTNLTLVQECAIHELVQKTSLNLHLDSSSKFIIIIKVPSH